MDWWIATIVWLGTLFGPGDADPECLLLGRLDALRAQAFAASDEHGLSAVYADDELRRKDIAVLRSWSDRGFMLHGMGQYRESCQVEHRADDAVRLAVVDRLAPAWAEDADGRRRALPADGETRRTVTLTRSDGTWQISGSW